MKAMAGSIGQVWQLCSLKSQAPPTLCSCGSGYPQGVGALMEGVSGMILV
jgi:hypothetical protein